MRARDIMTTPVTTVTPSTSLQDFARLCAEDRISGAPVLRNDGTLLGIISKTDLVTRLLTDDPRFGTRAEVGFSSGAEPVRQVADIMQTDIVTVDPNLPAHEVAARMADAQVHRVLVLEGGRLAGIITSLDLLRHYPR